MKKTLRLAMPLLIVAAMLTGCMRYEAAIDTTGPGKKYSMAATVYYSKEKIDLLGNGDGLDGITDLPVVTVGGREYYKDASDPVKMKYSAKKPSDGMIVTRHSFYAANATESLDGASDAQEQATDEAMSEAIERITVKVAFREKIKKTNGKLSRDKKTVRFIADFTKKGKKINKDNPLGEIYAYTASSTSTLQSDRKLMKKYSEK